VTAPSATPNINFALHAGGTITGTVTNATTSAPVAGVGVEFYSNNGAGPWWLATTDTQGGYTSPNLSSGSYFVRAVPPTASGLVGQLYNNLPCLGGSCSITTGTAVAVTSPNTTLNIDFALLPGPTITGTVTNATTSAPVAGVYLHFNTSSGALVGSATSDAQGRYTSPGLPTG
jgi:hypothetical protein